MRVARLHFQLALANCAWRKQPSGGLVRQDNDELQSDNGLLIDSGISVNLISDTIPATGRTEPDQNVQ